jgi:hypothetical protein
MDGLTHYRVSLWETKDDEQPIVFDCWAEDFDHAKEQALDAYPEGEIIVVAPRI